MVFYSQIVFVRRANSPQRRVRLFDGFLPERMACLYENVIYVVRLSLVIAVFTPVFEYVVNSK